MGVASFFSEWLYIISVESSQMIYFIYIVIYIINLKVKIKKSKMQVKNQK